MGLIEKVTGFVTCVHQGRTFLLLFQHPFAGVQLPAGSVEVGEQPEMAAEREVAEETGILVQSPGQFLGQEDLDLPEGLCALTTASTVYSRPDPTSFDWVRIRRGIIVQVLRQQGEYTQIHYEEFDRYDQPETCSFAITGWVSNAHLARRQIRYFYHFRCPGNPDESWDVYTDNHTFHLFWAAVDELPDLVPPQAPWLDWLLPVLKATD